MATRVSASVVSDRLNTSRGQGARQVGPKRVATEYLPAHINNSHVYTLNYMSAYSSVGSQSAILV